MITEFRVGAAHTFNLGNFESFRIEASITISVNEGDDYEALTTQAQAALKEQLTRTYTEQRRKSRQVAAD